MSAVLIVGVGVDDEVGALLDGGVDAGDERRREPLVAAHADDVIHAAGARDVGGAVAGAVIDDERFDDVDPGHGLRQIGERRRQRLRLVQARDLDDELLQRHGTAQLPFEFRQWPPVSASITPSHVMRRATS